MFTGKERGGRKKEKMTTKNQEDGRQTGEWSTKKGRTNIRMKPHIKSTQENEQRRKQKDV